MQRPPPLRTDGSNAFARYSMQERVPRIVREVVDRNPDYPDATKAALERLAGDIEGNEAIPPPRPPSPDAPAWAAADEEHRGQTWLSTEWFYAELACYRELVCASRFWETGRDPFGPAKEEELMGERPWARLEAALGQTGRERTDRIAALLEASLWGNRVDLSYRVAASRVDERKEDLLVDERMAAVPLLAEKGANVHVVADNAGTELALDLALVAAILEEPTARVTIHLKMQPMFVSDAMPADAWLLIARMGSRRGILSALAQRLRAGFAATRLVLAPDFFWNGPHFLWEAPAHMALALSSASVVVLKGDANYRRLIGDAMWQPATPFAQACAFLPAPVLCLRTMKSDPVLGLPDGLAERLDATEARWRIDGQRGVIQARTVNGNALATAQPVH